MTWSCSWCCHPTGLRLKPIAVFLAPLAPWLLRPLKVHPWTIACRRVSYLSCLVLTIDCVWPLGHCLKISLRSCLSPVHRSPKALQFPWPRVKLPAFIIHCDGPGFPLTPVSLSAPGVPAGAGCPQQRYVYLRERGLQKHIRYYKCSLSFGRKCYHFQNTDSRT